LPLHAGTGELPQLLRGFDAALVFSRAQSLAARLRSVTPQVAVRDPQPRAGSGHAADWYAGALDDIGVALAGSVPALVPSPEERAAAEDVTRGLPAGFLALHPGSGSPSKNWPAQRFAELVDTAAAGERVIVVHGPSDDDPVSRLRTLLPRALVAHGLPLPVLGAVLSQAGLFVGNDSGVTHLAAAYAAPTLALFGPTDPGVWAPPGARVIRAPGNDLARLSVADVAAHVSGCARPAG
jgi:ADP-heptose:LPS heptosyltransferase